MSSIDLDDEQQFWLAYLHTAEASSNSAWYDMEEPWSTFLLLDLVVVTEETPLILATPAFFQFKLTSKGRELLRTLPPEVIIEKAVQYDKYQVALDWMSHISPEYLPRFLTHPTKWVRNMAQARTQYIEEFLTGVKE